MQKPTIKQKVLDKYYSIIESMVSKFILEAKARPEHLEISYQLETPSSVLILYKGDPWAEIEVEDFDLIREDADEVNIAITFLDPTNEELCGTRHSREYVLDAEDYNTTGLHRRLIH